MRRDVLLSKTTGRLASKTKLIIIPMIIINYPVDADK